MSLAAGQLLAQRYRLGRRIAVGGMGEVWEAADLRLDRPVAVKVLKPELSGDPEFRQRFHTEARLTASLNHPGIAAVHDYGDATGDGDTPGTAFLVMELVLGESLADILLRQPRLSPEWTLDILGQAGDALQAAHQRGLVHRDIKPGNILIGADGAVKLTDFGIAKAADTAPMTHHGMVMGTAHYIAPEQAAGGEAGPGSDVYALGVVGYECLAGHRPFQADNPVTVALMHIRDAPPPLPPDVPAPVRGLIEAAMAKDPRQRYHSGGEFAGAVFAVRAGEWPPPPAGLGGVAPTAVLPGQHPAPGFPPTRVMPAAGPPADAYPGPPPGPPGPRTAGPRPAGAPRRRARRGALLIPVALLAVLGLVLGGYAFREWLRDAPEIPFAGGEQAPGQPANQPAPPPAPPPQPPPTTEPEPTTPVEEPEEVFVIPTDYVGRTGEKAAEVARSKGLTPLVVYSDGDDVPADARDTCLVTGTEPVFGVLEPGATLTLTCRGLR